MGGYLKKLVEEILQNTVEKITPPTWTSFASVGPLKIQWKCLFYNILYRLLSFFAYLLTNTHMKNIIIF
jgi:Zn-dependent protease